MTERRYLIVIEGPAESNLSAYARAARQHGL